MTKPITLHELLAELERAGIANKRAADGYSAAELSEIWGCCQDVALKRIRQAMAAGLAKFAGYERKTNICGRNMVTPLYSFSVGGKKPPKS